MLKNIKAILNDSELSLDEKIFESLLLVGAIVSLIGTVETMFVGGSREMLYVIVIALVSMIVSCVLCFGFRKINSAAFIAGFIMVYIVCPQLFIHGGGIKGGGLAWFICGLVYVFLMTSGIKLLLMVFSAIILDGIVFIHSYKYPSSNFELMTRKNMYIDSFFAFVSVGIAVGLIIVFMKKVYSKERKLVLEQKKELEKIYRTRNRFFTNMSHELRTPISTIIGLNELIKRENKDKEIAEYANNIDSAGLMLLSLVNDIIDMSKIEQQKMEIVDIEYNTKKLFSEIVSMIKIHADKKNLKLLVNIDENIPCKLLGDEKRIKQVIINILNNAIKYTKEGSVTFEVQIEKQDSDKIQLKVVVSDTGIGIKKDDIKYLFDNFSRMEMKENVNVEGSGLGLSICKQLVQLMGGEITVDSIYKKGSIFTVYLEQQIIDSTPISKDSNEGVAEVKNGNYDHSFEAPTAKILIIDDNVTNAIVIEKLLQPTKMQIDIASNVSDVYEKVSKKNYNVILSDYIMPELNGGELLKKIRTEDGSICKNTPAIVMTANGQAEAKRICDMYGFDSYIEKPVSANALEEMIFRYLSPDIVRSMSFSIEGNNIFNHRHKRKRNVCITTDCTCQIPKELQLMYNIKFMHVYVHVGEGRFKDISEINTLSILRYIENGDVNIKMDDIPDEEYEQFFADALSEAEDVIHISMTKISNIESIYVAINKAKVVSSAFDHVHVVDSGGISAVQSILTLYAAKLVQNGYTKKDILEKIEDCKKRIVDRFILPKVECLTQYKSNRKFTFNMLQALNLYPIISINRNKIKIIRIEHNFSEKTWKKSIKHMLVDPEKIDSSMLFILYVGYNKKFIQQIQDEILKYKEFDLVVMQEASLTMACSLGVGAIEIGYMRKQI